MKRFAIFCTLVCLTIESGGLRLWSAPTASAPGQTPASNTGGDVTSYRLGPEDSLLIRVEHADELGSNPYAIDLNGDISVPRIGNVHAAGRTVLELQQEVASRFSKFLMEPVVTVAIAEYRSQPVSVLGEVNAPGTHQVRGNKRLVEVLSEAGGLKEGAGDEIVVSRQTSSGTLPLANAKPDPSGNFTTGSVRISSILEANHPENNIPIFAHDVLTVPRAKLVYVIGAVRKPGGFTLTDRDTISVVEAVSMAEGLDRTASAPKAVIIRRREGSAKREEVPVDIKRMMTGQTADQLLSANDILYVPTSASKNASLRILEAVIQTGTGVAVYGRY